MTNLYTPWVVMDISEAEYFKRLYLEMSQNNSSLHSQLADLRMQYDEMRAAMITALNGALAVLLLGEHVNKEEAVSYLKELTSKYSPQPTGAVKGEKPPEDQY